MKKYATQIEALSEIIRMASEERKINWADVGRVRRLASHFGITENEVLGLIHYHGTMDDMLEWLTKNKPKKGQNATI